jgi:hypothetical protein
MTSFQNFIENILWTMQRTNPVTLKIVNKTVHPKYEEQLYMIQSLAYALKDCTNLKCLKVCLGKIDNKVVSKFHEVFSKVTWKSLSGLSSYPPALSSPSIHLMLDCTNPKLPCDLYLTTTALSLPTFIFPVNFSAPPKNAKRPMFTPPPELSEALYRPRSPISLDHFLAA